MPLALLVVLTSGLISVPASHWQTVNLTNVQPETSLEISFQVMHGQRVQLMLLEPKQAERFRRGISIDPLLTTGFQNSGRFRYRIAGEGDYVLLLDNRIEGRAPALVNLTVETFPYRSRLARELPPEKRRLVITLSLLFFGATIFFSARQLLKNS